MRGKNLKIISCLAIMLALFLISYLIYNLIILNFSTDELLHNPSITKDKEEKMFNIDFGNGFYTVDGNIITLTKPDMSLTTIYFIFKDVTGTSETKNFNFEIVFEPNIDFTIKDTKVSFKYTEECKMTVKIIIEEKNYMQIETFFIKN